VAREIDPDHLLVETDSPVAYGGIPARPAWAWRISEALARIRGEHPEALRETLAHNLRRYLRRTPMPASPEGPAATGP
jgi:Tat protein secretion system quality control protein TatD with DNase activity